MQDLDRIEKLFKMLGSDNDNEASAALRLLKSNLQRQGKNISDLSNYLFGGYARQQRQQDERTDRRQQEHKDAEEPRYYKAYDEYEGASYYEITQALLRMAVQRKIVLTEWETGFLNSIWDKKLKDGKGLSAKQRDCLVKIVLQHAKGNS